MDVLHNHKLALAFLHTESKHKMFTFFAPLLLTKSGQTTVAFMDKAMKNTGQFKFWEVRTSTPVVIRP